jgi:hypothetical protein
VGVKGLKFHLTVFLTVCARSMCSGSSDTVCAVDKTHSPFR